ncbi:MAG: hypothetical protein KC478_00775 [Bacteriovoracaceae bacterium]|nr:hypothetical protein [Bacteriovoracaceae bacterium]
MNNFSRALVSALILVFTPLLQAKVDPPNYDFSVDSLQVFMPGQKLVDAQKKHGKAQAIKKVGAFTIYKFYVAHIRYKFPVLAQVINGEITDFYARLPAYFLHDIFHQSLINRLKKQDEYKRVEEQAVYVWKNKANMRHIYSGACSITCFPVFYSVYPEKHNYGTYTPIIKAMTIQEQLKDNPFTK